MSSCSTVGRARLPNDLSIRPEDLMIPYLTVLICLKTRQAVAERWITARRVFGPIRVHRIQQQLRFNDKSFGSLALPTDEQELIPTVPYRRSCAICRTTSGNRSCSASWILACKEAGVSSGWIATSR
jgi:hypothetical protein